MKKDYQKPVVDKIDFCYRDQVVAASGEHGQYTCYTTWNDRGIGDTTCTPTQVQQDQIG